MKGSRVAKRYARALLDLADKGNEENWGAELERLAAMVESPELLERLASPELSEQSRLDAMAKIAERLESQFSAALVRGCARAPRAHPRDWRNRRVVSRPA